MKGGAGLFKYGRDEPLHWLPACPLPERAGSPVGRSVGVWYLSEKRTRKPTLAAAGSSASRGGRLRIPARTPRSLLRTPTHFPLILSGSGVCRAAGRALNGKEDPCRLRLGNRAARRDFEGERQRLRAEGRGLVSEKGVKPHAEDWHLRTPCYRSLGPMAG